jgi:hypothetical protein
MRELEKTELGKSEEGELEELSCTAWKEYGIANLDLCLNTLLKEFMYKLNLSDKMILNESELYTSSSIHGRLVL